MNPVARWRLVRRRRLTWWLIHGPVRSGTTYLLDVVAANARLRIGDWGLAPALGLPPDLPHIRFDRERARSDVSRNILANAPAGGGRSLDLVYKCAQLRSPEHRALIELWGPPERTIFCVREPSGHLASAVRKFPDVAVQAFRDEYVRDIETHRVIGGEVLVYGEGLTTDDYRRFVDPLTIPDDPALRFSYHGGRADELVTEAMLEAFRSVTTGDPRPNSDRP